MSRRIPFPFADHHDTGDHTDAMNGLITTYIAYYESALADEYMSGDIDCASYNEGAREAYEGVLVDLLGIDQGVMDAYWGRGERPSPPTDELPFLGGNPLVDYAQVEGWSGHRLDADQWDRLAAAIPESSIPEAIGTIVAAIVAD